MMLKTKFSSKVDLSGFGTELFNYRLWTYTHNPETSWAWIQLFASKMACLTQLTNDRCASSLCCFNDSVHHRLGTCCKFVNLKDSDRPVQLEKKCVTFNLLTNILISLIVHPKIIHDKLGEFFFVNLFLEKEISGLNIIHFYCMVWIQSSV